MSTPKFCFDFKNGRETPLAFFFLTGIGMLTGRCYFRGNLCQHSPYKLIFFFKKKLKVGAFNVKTLGRTKMSKPDVVENLENIICGFDLIVIQEVRDASLTLPDNLLTEINDGCGNSEFAVIAGERVGDTSYKEQYVYYYRPARVELLGTLQYPVLLPEDPDWVFNREPFVAHWRINTSADDDMSFTTIPLHVDPESRSDTDIDEINALADVYEFASNNFNTFDSILLGDFNADCSYVSTSDWDQVTLFSDSRFTWLLDNDVDTTTSGTHCAYDRIVVAGDTLSSRVVSAAVTRFDLALGLSPEEVAAVSDHFPVEVYVTEG